MTIDFGSIKSYNPDRGFGFVGHTFFNPDGKVFFHIKKIKKKHPELAQKLDSGEAFETVNFWYEIETTEKGEQVSKLWRSPENIPQSYAQELSDLIQKVESIWKNVDSPKPSWLDLVTTELAGVDRKHELSAERDNLESQLRAAEEERRRQAEALLHNRVRIALHQLKAAEEERRRQAEASPQNEIARIARRYGLDTTKASELHQLLTDLRPLGFTNSSDLSGHIRRYQLGYRYPTISGIVTMEDGGTAWEFLGGFPPRIYRIICQELNLANQGTSARAIDFESFQDIYSRNQE